DYRGTTSKMDVKAVQGTADDASVSKLCAAEKGYFKDEFLQYFVVKRARRSPLINRGYYSRVAAFDTVIHDFLSRYGTIGKTQTSTAKADSKITCQIVSLGAGFDTTFFKLKSAGGSGFRFIEVDLPDVVSRKFTIISATPELKKMIGTIEKPKESTKPTPTPTPTPAPTPTSPPKGDAKIDNKKNKNSAAAIVIGRKKRKLKEPLTMHAGDYHLCECDLRSPKALDAAMKVCKANFSLPTLFFAECVLIYLDPEHSTGVIRWAAGKCREGKGIGRFISYGQVRPNDPFGSIMIKNFAARGCALRGLRAYPSLESQVKRFKDAGWSTAKSSDMNTVYSEMLDPDDTKRVAKLEMFDEFEEWHLFGAHYALTIADYSPTSESVSATTKSRS
ncbi:hypothetical protein AAMO2058_000665400, partial [Amorphochlora amoebiformis]